MVAAIRLPRAGRPPEPRAGEEAAAARLQQRLQLRPQGTRAQGKAFIEALKIFSHLANVSDCRSLVIHPASTTRLPHGRRGAGRRGHHPGTIRLSIGLEDADDLIDDLKRAFKVAEEGGVTASSAQ
ncbi:MAG: PLP-dependent transferase [Rubrivivax sp.]